MSATGTVDLAKFAEWASKLTRKFETDDITRVPRLMETAVAYAESYSGSFAFMRDMKAQVLSGNFLTLQQAKGVLNCARAEALRAKAAPQPVATVTDSDTVIPNGTYTVVFDNGDWMTVKLSEPTWMGSGSEGLQQVAYLHGPDNETDFCAVGFLNENGIVRPWKSVARNLSPEFIDGLNDALLIIRDEDRDEMQLAYALRSGRCARCNRKLTVPASIHRGLGPECAKKA